MQQQKKLVSITTVVSDSHPYFLQNIIRSHNFNVVSGGISLFPLYLQRSPLKGHSVAFRGMHEQKD